MMALAVAQIPQVVVGRLVRIRAQHVVTARQAVVRLNPSNRIGRRGDRVVGLGAVLDRCSCLLKRPAVSVRGPYASQMRVIRVTAIGLACACDLPTCHGQPPLPRLPTLHGRKWHRRFTSRSETRFGTSSSLIYLAEHRVEALR